MKAILDYKAYAALARAASAEGIVLLRNEANCLPIRPGSSVAVFGRAQRDTIYCGTGSGGMVNVPYVISIADGLRAVYRLDEALDLALDDWLRRNPYDKGEGWAGTPLSQKEFLPDEELIREAAGRGDYALMVIGRSAGEDRDSVPEKGAYYLREEEEKLMAALRSHFRYLVVILNSGNLIDMSWQDTCRPDAILYAWQGGCEGGSALADVISGRVNPSGGLPDTIARRLEDYPAHANYGSADHVFYREDIYVGYRHFETFAPESVLYPFGFGLSYTTFRLEAENFTSDDKGFAFDLRIENTGSEPGKKAWQIYAQVPQGRLGQPKRRLLAFGKTGLLEPGVSVNVRTFVPKDMLASFDDSGVTGHLNAWVLEAGDYRFYAGFDVRDAVPAGEWTLSETCLLEQLNEALSPYIPFERVRAVCREDGALELSHEPVPLRLGSLDDVIANRHAKAPVPPVRDLPVPAEQGLPFDAWREGRLSLDDYLARFDDRELIFLSRGIGMSPSGVTPGVAGAAGGVSAKLKASGMPLTAFSDGPSGIRLDDGGMAFSVPNGTALAASFNTELNEALFSFVGLELRKNKIESLLGPGMNIHRYPLNGRNFEYFSEDPVLTAGIALAQVRGLASRGVAATVKHFAMNNQEFARNDCDSVVSRRAAREIYLKPFELVVKSGALRSLMTSYNRVNGVWASSNYELNTTILREQWGYDGIVISDWWAKCNWGPGQEGDRRFIGAMIRAQNDLYMVNISAEENGNHDLAEEELAEGRFDRRDLLRNAGNICRFIRDHYHGYHELTVETLNEPEKQEGQTETLELGVLRDRLLPGPIGYVSARGSALRLVFETPDYARYELRLGLQSSASEVAQHNISVSLNGIPLKNLSLRGSVSREEQIIFQANVNPNNYMEIRFSEGGMRVTKADLQRI